jgi:hypothetical protein
VFNSSTFLFYGLKSAIFSIFSEVYSVPSTRTPLIFYAKPNKHLILTVKLARFSSSSGMCSESPSFTKPSSWTCSVFSSNSNGLHSVPMQLADVHSRRPPCRT